MEKEKKNNEKTEIEAIIKRMERRKLMVNNLAQTISNG